MLKPAPIAGYCGVYIIRLFKLWPPPEGVFFPVLWGRGCGRRVLDGGGLSPYWATDHACGYGRTVPPSFGPQRVKCFEISDDMLSLAGVGRSDMALMLESLVAGRLEAAIRRSEKPAFVQHGRTQKRAPQ